MNVRFERRLAVAWVALSAVTLSQLAVAAIGGAHAPGPDTAVAASAIVIALVKVRIILREFMEVRHAPDLLRRLTDLWVVLTGAILLGSHLVGVALSRG